MGYVSLFAVAFALSLDAFAVSIVCGIKLKQLWIKKFTKISLFFGGFQAGMPLAGWLVGYLVQDFISQYAAWIAGLVFLVLGMKTLVEAYRGKHHSQSCEQCTCDDWSCLISLATATSIDAFLVGLVLAVFQIPLIISVGTIGLVTFVISFIGCLIGNRAHHVVGKKVEFVAGLILIALAIKEFLAIA